jgi:hypothetical protein
LDRGAETACSPQNGTDASEQLFEHEWFDEVVVGAELEAVQPILDRVAGCQENNRQLARAAQLARQLKPIPTR